MILGMIILASTDAISKYLTVTFAVIQILWIRYMVFAVIGTLVVLQNMAFQDYAQKGLLLKFLEGSYLPEQTAWQSLP